MVTEIRPCRESDLPSFYRFGSPVHVEHCRREFARAAAGEVAILIAVGVDSLPIGKVHVDLVGKAAEGVATISAASVPAELRGRGIGTALMEAAETLIAERGMGVAELMVEDANADARRLYQRLGYRVVATTTASYDTEGDDGRLVHVSNPAKVMRKALGRGALSEQVVRAALAEIPDPEIPVVSLVDLGVVRDVAVEDGRVRVEFTPTFLGCPALEVMRDAMAARIRDLGAEPEIEVVLDDSWSTDLITPEGREKLRAAGFAPPAPRGAGTPQLVQLQSAVFRCPYCGSTETRLENLFGPTPCRSLRYCQSCRQPFEQFKTI